MMSMALSGLFIAGCAPVVGGPCDYKKLRSVATVEQVEGNISTLLVATHYSDYVPERDRLRITSSKPLAVNETLPATINIITKGSCTPYSVDIHVDDYLQITRSVIYFTPQGQPDANSTDTVKQVTRKMHALLQTHPHAVFKLHGHTDFSRSSEYSASLGYHYANLIQKLFIAEGIAQQNLRILSHGKEAAEHTQHLDANRVSITIDFNQTELFHAL